MKIKQMIFLTNLTLILFIFCACANNSLIKPRKTRTTSTIKKTTPLYYDFRDVLIPNELNIVETSITGTGEHAQGIMSLKGRVELSSIVNFFANNMAKDNWKLISVFKSPITYMLFNKDKRWCVINIIEGQYSFPSKIEIWVAKSQDSGTFSNHSDIGFSESLLHE